MAYINEYLLDVCQAYGWMGGDGFKTTIVEMSNGRENRNAEWAQAKHQYQVPFNNITKPDYAIIKSAHMLCRGQLNAFRFRDRLDFEATDEAFGIGDGVETEFQLLKQSLQDGVSYQRLVFAPDPTVTIKVNGIVTAATVDYERGTVTFGAPPANAAGLEWTGTFGVWVRFNQDYLPFSIDNGNGTDHYVNGSVDLIEVAAPPEETS